MEDAKPYLRIRRKGFLPQGSDKKRRTVHESLSAAMNRNTNPLWGNHLVRHEEIADTEAFHNWAVTEGRHLVLTDCLGLE